MKNIYILAVLSLLFGCQENDDNSKAEKEQNSAVKSEPIETYKPGFGGFMSTLQIHHAKLWFAGKNENWELADFEIHEIEETVEDIQKYQSARPETIELLQITPSLDSLMSAIDRKDILAFDRSYNLLTNSCNVCHQNTDYGFIQIKTPDEGVWSNQEFKLSSE